MSLLTYIILLPLLAALALAFVPCNYRVVMRAVALAATFICALLAIMMFLQFNSALSGYQFEQRVSWIDALGISYHVGVDGINVGLVLMGALVAFAAACVSWEIKDREKEPKWKSQLAIHGTGLVMCLSILVITVFEKFSHGGWVTVAITGLVIALCFAIRRHYDEVRAGLRRLDDILTTVPVPEAKTELAASDLDTNAPTAVISISSFSGFGLHQILSIHKAFPNYFKQFLFVSAAVVDSGNFKGAEELDRLQTNTEENLLKYIHWTQAHGFRADYRMALGTEAVETVEAICRGVAKEFPRAIFFTGRLIFKEEKWYHRLLHNETPHAIQRRLQFDGIQAMVLPIRVL